LAIASLGFFAFQEANSGNGVVQNYVKEHRFSGGGQAGYTGAPSEATCFNCHGTPGGSTLDGSTENQVLFLDNLTPVTEYTPGNTYTITVQMASSPSKKGFSAVALDGTNANAGSFTGDSGIGGTQDFVAAGTGRHYVSHLASSNTSTQTIWGWTWTAPATDVGPVTVYLCTNIANDDNGSTGDAIYLSQHVISPASGGASIGEESVDNTKFTAGFNAESSKVTMSFSSLAVDNMFFNLVDMNGRSVFTYEMGESEFGENNQSLVLPSSIENGMYIVHFFVGNKAMSANILVKRYRE